MRLSSAFVHKLKIDAVTSVSETQADTDQSVPDSTEDTTEDSTTTDQTSESLSAGDSFLTSAQTEKLPKDCLLAKDAEGVAYCFSPAKRQYTAVLANGSVRYDFNLPGDNSTNSVEGLFLGPEGSERDVCHR